MNRKGLLITIVSLVMLVLASCSPQPTATPVNTPTKVPIPSPSRRGYVSMAYDAESDKIILFGGQTTPNSAICIGETWAYDINTNQWTLMKPTLEPSKRGAADLVYDSESDRIILFGGGNETGVLNDTWAYDYNTNAWTQMANGPLDHLGGRLAYDAESDRVILFGGTLIATGYLYDDTWAYDFNTDTWTDMKPAVFPSGRNYHGMTYDSESDRVILWGGEKDIRTWAYDYNTNAWQEMPPGGEPDMRWYNYMVYDVKADRVIMYGGPSITADQTWAYDYNSNTWTNLGSDPNPGRISGPAMAYSTAADKVILFGGMIDDSRFTAKAWSFDYAMNLWTNVIP